MQHFLRIMTAAIAGIVLSIAVCHAKTYAESLAAIPKIMEDPIQLLDEVEEMSKTNVMKYICTIMDAAKTYPCSESVRSNKIEKLALYAEIATNYTPTVVLKVPASEIGNSQIQLWLQGINKTRAANGEDPIPMLNDGHEAILDADWNLPVQRVNEPTGYFGQIF